MLIHADHTNVSAVVCFCCQQGATVSAVHSIIHSFIHSYSFNVQVDITQLQTDREARKEAVDPGLEKT